MRLRPFATTLAVTALALASGPSTAQTHLNEHRLVAHTLASGPLANPGDREVVVFDRMVSVPEAPWIRLTFRRVELGQDSYLRLTSIADGKAQRLSRLGLLQWQNTSAYFNGSAVRVELVAGPRTAGNVVEVGDLYGGLVPTEPESQCGPTDDRVDSDEPERGRLLDIGCTAAIYTEGSCMITAGHCLDSFAVTVLEFNVPPSNPDGSLRHPGPEDQYSVDRASREFVNGGVGNDWGLFRVFPNGETGLMPFEKQGARLPLSAVNPPVGDPINIVGYGVDSGADNQTQQVSFGPITTSTDSLVQYQADTEGGNSGSSVVWDDSGEVVAIHTHGGCSFGGGGSNSGTAITNNGLEAALADYCPIGGGIPCADIQDFRTRCTVAGDSNLLEAGVLLTDASHDGESITLSLDGADRSFPIVGRIARIAGNGAPGGAHTVEIEDPAGCAPAQIVICP